MFRIPFSFKKCVITAAASGLAIAGLFVATPGSAQADSAYVRIAPTSNPFLFLDVSEGSKGDGAKIIQWSLSGDNQVWYFHETAPGDFEIVNKRSGKCITTNGQDAQLMQWLCKGIPTQIWNVTRATGTPGPGLQNTMIINPVSRYSAMGVAGNSTSQGAAIVLGESFGTPSQRFNLLAAA
jgi:hypothetical protein